MSVHLPPGLNRGLHGSDCRAGPGLPVTRHPPANRYRTTWPIPILFPRRG